MSVAQLIATHMNVPYGRVVSAADVVLLRCALVSGLQPALRSRTGRGVRPPR